MKKPKSYELDLDEAATRKQRAIRRSIANLKGPMTLDAVRQALDLTYDDLALAIDATDRGYTWRLCRYKVEPAWSYAQHVERCTKGVVPASRVMGP